MFYNFWYPRELVTYQGTQFTSHLIENLLSHHKIKHGKSTSYHPQVNGQVEVTKKALETIHTKGVSINRKYWADRLVEATCAYNKTWKTTTSFTPCDFFYGKSTLHSVEFEYNTLRKEARLDLDVTREHQEKLV